VILYYRASRIPSGARPDQAETLPTLYADAKCTLELRGWSWYTIPGRFSQGLRGRIIGEALDSARDWAGARGHTVEVIDSDAPGRD
jgi:hypothetical protein